MWFCGRRRPWGEPRSGGARARCEAFSPAHLRKSRRRRYPDEVSLAPLLWRDCKIGIVELGAYECGFGCGCVRCMSLRPERVWLCRLGVGGWVRCARVCVAVCVGGWVQTSSIRTVAIAHLRSRQRPRAPQLVAHRRPWWPRASRRCAQRPTALKPMPPTNLVAIV